MKRAFDLLMAIAGILLLSPALILLSVLIRAILGAGVLFQQTRPGLQGKLFNLYKFRTMTYERDDAGNLLPDGQRLTRLGRFLRSTSLDELPQLYNVLKGEMSIVGPRPLYMKYLSYYTEQEKKRHTVRPGITGWAQIHGRNQSRWDERLARDVWYVRHWSLALDLRIAALTVALLARGRGFEAAPTAAMADLDAERAAPAAGSR
jgi:lipopolysaccharide/colanic/teichoic acid biosynthesis glycosyltransferase